MKEAYQSATTGFLAKIGTTDGNKLSIFQKPRVVPNLPSLRTEQTIYNGIGGTAKVLQSDVKTSVSINSLRPSKMSVIKKKKLSPSAAFSK